MWDFHVGIIVVVLTTTVMGTGLQEGGVGIAEGEGAGKSARVGAVVEDEGGEVGETGIRVLKEGREVPR